MNRSIRWIAPALLCAVLALCFGPLHADADGAITYIRRGWNGTSVTQTEVTEEIA
ncbi:MAG: hypothetical protein IKG23_00150 [Clostridia bacterium]|nr:hypothetical protein [Clostridia bacterium]MBR3494532.1 hypothetical protein [Clostridia bacterium]MBR7173043.1 hypothetical protein [Clostridia bacterium]